MVHLLVGDFLFVEMTLILATPMMTQLESGPGMWKETTTGFCLTALTWMATIGCLAEKKLALAFCTTLVKNMMDLL